MGVAPAILWVGPFFCLLFVSAGVPSLWRLLRGRGLQVSDLLVVLGAAIYVAYIFKLAGNLPKIKQLTVTPDILTGLVDRLGA